MSVDPRQSMKQWTRDWRRAVQARQQELKTLTDDGLMQLEKSLWTMEKVFGTRPDREEVVTREAAGLEVRRRARAACWFWRRWRKPGECDRWLAHMQEMEATARDLTLRHLSKS